MANVTTSSKPVAKFTVYQNPAVSAALTINSLRPSKLTIFFILILLSTSALSLISFIRSSRLRYVTQDVAYIFFKVVEVKSAKEAPKAKASASPSDKLVPLHQPFTGSGHTPHLHREKSITSGGNKMHSFSTPSKPPVSSSIYLVPSQSPNIKTPTGQEKYLEKFLADFDEKFSMAAGKMATPPQTINGFGSPGTNTYGTTRSTPLRVVRMSPGSQKFSTPPKKGEGDLPPPMSMEDSIAAFERLVYLVPSQSPNMKTPTGQEQYVSSPWRGSPSRKISTEKQLETFLADFDEKFSMFAGKMATPPPTINGFGSPGTNTSVTTRSTPLRAVRMSPGSPMSMEVSIAAFERIGVYPQIEQWRDNLRQWFSLVLLNPLLAKIETSHLK
nr:hypothetical protein [Tanacetum cinerariifolium]